MKTRYKFIHFTQEPDGSWVCRNNKTTAALGQIGWYPPWRQFVVVPMAHTAFSVDCLADIGHFMGQLSHEGG